MMKLRCPRCRQKLTVPDEYAGKAVRCPACNRAFMVPKPQAAVAVGEPDAGLDLVAMAAMESQSGTLDGDSSSPAVDAPSPADVDPNVRVCPHCKKQMRTQDPNADVLCSHCWEPIPGLASAAAQAAADRRRPRERGGVLVFYSELASSLVYPFPAISSLATAVLFAIGAGLVPVALVTGVLRLIATGQVPSMAAAGAEDLSTASWVLLGIFAAEFFFFSAVAIHVFLEVVRATTKGADRPLPLVWTPSQWGRSLPAYLLLVLYYALLGYLIAELTVRSDATVTDCMRKGQLATLLSAGGKPLFVGLIVISAAIPMSLIGVALAPIFRGLSPFNGVQAIARTHAHYAFLLLLLLVFGAVFGAAFCTILFEWFLPQFDLIAMGATEKDFIQVGLAVLAWGGTVGVFFYGTYVLARLHGLFARAFRNKLAFLSYCPRRRGQHPEP